MMFDTFRGIHAPQGKAAQPVIDHDKCEVCGHCISICPLAALEIENKKVVATPHMRMNDKLEPSCFGCRDCEAVCQSGAITIKGSIEIHEGLYKSVLTGREIKMPMPLGKDKDYHETEQELSEVEKLIYRRRSNRIFKKDPVPRELIERILEAGRFAPTEGNSQPVKYIVLDDRQQIDKLRDGMMTTLRLLGKTYLQGGPIRRTLLRLYGRKDPNSMDIRPIYAIKAMLKDKKPTDLFQKAPALILVLADQRGVGQPPLTCGIAAQNIVLAAHALGLGTCYIGFVTVVNMNPFLKRKLGIKYPYRVYSSIALGYPKVEQDKVVAREVTPVEWVEKGTL